MVNEAKNNELKTSVGKKVITVNSMVRYNVGTILF